MNGEAGWGEKKGKEGGRKERQRRKRRVHRDTVYPASPWPQEVGHGAAPQLCLESPWRLSAGLFMINTLR